MVPPATLATPKRKFSEEFCFFCFRFDLKVVDDTVF
jgi:hypothetical protein